MTKRKIKLTKKKIVMRINNPKRRKKRKATEENTLRVGRLKKI